MFEKEIKEALKLYGLDETLFDKIKVEKAEQVSEAVRDFAINYLAEQKAKSELDKKVKELEAEKEKFIKAEKERLVAELKAKNPTTDEKKPDEMPSWMKPFLEKFDMQDKKFSELDEKEKAKARKELIQKHLSDSKLPDKLVMHITAEDEAGIKEQIDTFKQIINDSIAERNGGDNEKQKGVASPAVVDEIVNELNSGEGTQSFPGVNIGELK